jgi:hypothetical protein
MAHITVQQVVDHFAGVEGMPFPANSQVNGIYAEVGRYKPFHGATIVSLTYRVERAGTVMDFPPPVYEGWKEHQIALRERYQEVMACALLLAQGEDDVYDIYFNDEPRSVEAILNLIME